MEKQKCSFCSGDEVKKYESRFGTELEIMFDKWDGTTTVSYESADGYSEYCEVNFKYCPHCGEKLEKVK